MGEVQTNGGDRSSGHFVHLEPERTAADLGGGGSWFILSQLLRAANTNIAPDVLAELAGS